MAKKYISSGGKTFIDSEDKLIDYLEKGAKGFTTAIAKDTAKRLRKNTADLVYRNYEPSKYQRTMDMLNAIVGPGFNGGEGTVNMGNGFEAYVGFDIDRMRLIEGHGGVWGTHVGFQGQDAREAVIEGFENNGFEVYSRRGVLIYSRDPVGMIQKTVDEIESALANVDREVPDFETVENGVTLSLSK